LVKAKMCNVQLSGFERLAHMGDNSRICEL
jgi:hypothetical protein